MPDFRLVAPFQPTGDQPQAIEKLTEGLSRGLRHQTLLGVTGSGKSLVPDEPVLIGRATSDGDITWSIDRIGEVVDQAMSVRDVHRDAHGTDLASALTGTAHYVQTVDPTSHKPIVRRVTEFSRHDAPATMWRVTTSDGRHVTVTGDHNFVRSDDRGSLETVRTTDLRRGDALPIPARIHGPQVPRRRADVAEVVDPRSMRVKGPQILDRDVAMHSRWLLGSGGSASLATLEPHHVRTLERFGRTWIVGILGHHRLPASVPLDDAMLELIGIFVAEGHVADRYALIAPGPEGYPLTVDRLDRCGIPFAHRGRDEVTLHGRVHAEFFRGLCGARSGEKHLPAFWPDLDDRALGRLLAGYFEGDGWVEPGSLAVVTKSERLANEIAYALLRFGIVGRLSVTNKRAVGTTHQGADYHLIAIRGAEDLASFQQHIGFLSDRKRAALERLVRTTIGGNADVLPVRSGGWIRASRRAVGATQAELAAVAGIDADPPSV